MPRWSKWLALAIAMVVAVGGAAWLWLASSASPAGGTREVDGLSAPVELFRDLWGVPHIFAATDEDAAAALGWAHAEDRLWQMEATRRLGAGRLAEVLGAAALPSDRWMRTLGLYDLARRQYAQLAERTRRLLDAYARGVNARLDGRDGPLPPEFLLLRFAPQPWTPADSLVWLKLMALRLSADRRDELLRARLAERLTPAQLGELWPDEPDAPVTLGSAAGTLGEEMLARLAAAIPELPGRPRGASNAWVLAGSGTESGKPLLANDPHLGFSMPLPWYLARIATPAGELAGATAPGFPAMILGHNGVAAWGITSSDIDVEDVFVERLDPADAGRYLALDGARAFERREETIAVKDGPPETLVVRHTRHGPVISDLPGVAGGADRRATVLSLAATYLAADDRTADALFDLNRARDVRAFLEAARQAAAPQQNVFWADVQGHIGWVAAGRIPLRPAGGGRLPAPGWTGTADWTGFLPFERQPQAIDPPSGRIVNANNRPVPPDWPLPIGGAWDAGFRARRIEQRLAAEMPQSLGRSAALQLDRLSLMARRLLPPMLDGLPATIGGDARRAAEMLRPWSGEMQADRPEPLIVAAWLREFVRVVAADELGPAFEEYWDFRPLFVEDVLNGRGSWCDDVTTPGVESCAAQLQAALQAAIDDLSRRFGDDPGRWRWGELHQVRFEHPLWRRVPVVSRLIDARVAIDGGNDTVLRAASRIADPVDPFAAVHGAGFRGVYDLADIGRSQFVLAAGQSGNPLSRHWRDMTPMWLAGGGIRLDATRESLQQEAEGRLLLRPADAAPPPP